MSDHSLSKNLTLNEMILNLGEYNLTIVSGLVLFSVTTTLVAYGLKKNQKEVLATKFLCPPIFMVTLPGVFFTLILLYMILFTKQNVMDAPFLVLLVPVWFGTTLIFYGRLVDFDQIPGFDKISGLITFCAITFLGILILLKLKIILLTMLSPLYAFGIVIALYVLWRKGFSKLFGKKT